MKVTGRSQTSFGPGLLTSGCLLATGRFPVEVGTLHDPGPRRQVTSCLVLVRSCPTSTHSFPATEKNSGGPAHKITTLCRQAGRPEHKTTLCGPIINGQHKPGRSQ